MDLELEAHHRALQSYKARDTHMLYIFALLLIYRKIKGEEICRGSTERIGRSIGPQSPGGSFLRLRDEKAKKHSKLASRTTRHCRGTSNKRNVLNSTLYAELSSISAVALLFSCCWCVIFPTRSRYARFLETVFMLVNRKTARSLVHYASTSIGP